MFKAVIIDDEKKTRDFIESIIENNFPNIVVYDKASSVIEGIKSIEENQPNIVFLDIEMQDGSGFDVLDAIPEKKFNFIFITAYNQYAVRAFKYSAIDYLLKPIDIDEFNFAVEKMIKNPISLTAQSDNFLVLKENIQSSIPLKLAIPSTNGFEYIKICEIIRFEADGRYTHLFLLCGRKITISKSLGEFNDLIIEKFFYRPHKSHIINLQHVKMFNKKEGGYIVMEDNSQVAISRNKREEFLQIMSGFNS